MYCMDMYVLYGLVCIVWTSMYCMYMYVLYGRVCIAEVEIVF